MNRAYAWKNILNDTKYIEKNEADWSKIQSAFGISHPKSRISHLYITNLLQRYDIIKKWVWISKNQRKVGGHYEDSGL